MILLTGATGNVGHHVAQQLQEQQVAFMATSRNSNHDNFKVMNFNDKQSIQDAIVDTVIDTVILITPADANMVTQQKNIVDVCQQQGVKRVVKLSGLGADSQSSIKLAKAHGEIEAYIKTTDMEYVFVRPNLFMQAVVYGSLDSINNEHTIYAPVSSGKISVIDAKDVANTLVKASLDKSLINTMIEITGKEALSFADMASLISEHCGQTIQFVPVSFNDAKNSMLKAGMDIWLVEAFIELYQIYEQGLGSSVITKDFEQVHKRLPRSFANFLQSIGKLATDD